jgi:hypothetical protein
MNARRLMSSKKTPDVPRELRAAIVVAAAWSVAWKGFSLWRAAGNGSKPWFVLLLLTNSLGVMDAIYLFGAGRRHPGSG